MLLRRETEKRINQERDGERKRANYININIKKEGK
jgi:hypothetical protein